MNLNPLSISTLVAVGCGLAVAACGSSAPNSSKSAAVASNGQRLLAFSQCMRAHGVPKFPDPTGRRIQIGPSTGVNPASPAFQAAQKACGGLGKGGPGGGTPTEADKLAMLNVSKCMRAHGLPNFPDPTTHPPTPGSNGANVVIGRNGVFLALGPGINPRSPAFQHAASVCGLLHGK
jgi:hypothetical protein